MASSASNDLTNIGFEAFALLEERLGQRAKPIVRPHQHYIIQPVAQGHAGAKAIDCYQAAQKYGGLVISEYSSQKPVQRKFYY